MCTAIDQSASFSPRFHNITNRDRSEQASGETATRAARSLSRVCVYIYVCTTWRLIISLDEKAPRLLGDAEHAMSVTASRRQRMADTRWVSILMPRVYLTFFFFFFFCILIYLCVCVCVFAFFPEVLVARRYNALL